MARQARSNDGGSAGRIAARRRAGRDAGKGAPQKSKGKGKKPKGSAVGRAFRVLMLMVVMACAGFFVVLVLDVGSALVGQVKLGETTMTELWGKVVDRVLDRDVPRPPADDAAARALARGRPRAAPAPRPRETTTTQAMPEQRAPVAAPRPEEYARHVEGAGPQADPQVARAQQRLDDILSRF